MHSPSSDASIHHCCLLVSAGTEEQGEWTSTGRRGSDPYSRGSGGVDRGLG